MNLITVLLLTMVALVKGGSFATLYEAVENNDVESVRQFIAAKNETLFIRTNHRLKVYPECYGFAIKNGNKEILDLLLNAKLNLWDYDPSGDLITLAFSRGETDMALSLLRRGVRPTYRQYKDDLLENRQDRIQQYINHGFFPHDGLLAKVVRGGNLEMLNIILVGNGSGYRREDMYDSISAIWWMGSRDRELKKQLTGKINAYYKENQSNMRYRRDPWDNQVLW